MKKSITTAIVALAVASAVHADMMPVPSLEEGPGQSLPICGTSVPQPAYDSSPLVAFCSITEPDFLPVGFLPELAADAGQPKALFLTDRQNSLSLCLYALFGLGLCRSAPWVRKLSLVVIPEWYHGGGPWQVGHSFAVSPDCHCPATVCFIQPDALAADLLPQYTWGMILFLWRESQSLPTLHASRGPPGYALRRVSCVPSVA